MPDSSSIANFPDLGYLELSCPICGSHMLKWLPGSETGRVSRPCNDRRCRHHVEYRVECVSVVAVLIPRNADLFTRVPKVRFVRRSDGRWERIV